MEISKHFILHESDVLITLLDNGERLFSYAYLIGKLYYSLPNVFLMNNKDSFIIHNFRTPQEQISYHEQILSGKYFWTTTQSL